MSEQVENINAIRDGARPSLLFVDDDPIIVNALSAVLEKEFDVITADSRRQVSRLTKDKTDYPVLIKGESGTGKELVADWLHRASYRTELPFLTINCAAFTPELLETQLFGHAKGAFTGAMTKRIRMISQANNNQVVKPDTKSQGEHKKNNNITDTQFFVTTPDGLPD